MGGNFLFYQGQSKKNRLCQKLFVNSTAKYVWSWGEPPTIELQWEKVVNTSVPVRCVCVIYTSFQLFTTTFNKRLNQTHWSSWFDTEPTCARFCITTVTDTHPAGHQRIIYQRLRQFPAAFSSSMPYNRHEWCSREKHAWKVFVSREFLPISS